jgi:hypothetical protein
VFWWHLINDYIPSRANLQRRHVDPLNICETWGASAETTFHALFECTYARMFRSKLRELSGVRLPDLHPDTWASVLLEDGTCKEMDSSIILCGTWSIWQSRNDSLHGKSPIEMKVAIDWALDTYFQLIPGHEEVEGQREHVLQTWQRPPSKRFFTVHNTIQR